jgi:hypothetical protein
MGQKLLENPEPGMKVRIKCQPDDTRGFLIVKDLLQNRKAEVIGTIYDFVDGHGGDVWYVVHDGTAIINVNGVDEWERSGIAPYSVSEMSEVG